MADEYNVPDGVYEDAKRFLGRILRPLVDPYIRERQRKAILRRFAPEFASHPAQVTSIVDYFSWHESDTDWKLGNGLLGAATYGELLHLWTNANLFVTYEANLVRFISRGAPYSGLLVESATKIRAPILRPAPGQSSRTVGFLVVKASSPHGVSTPQPSGTTRPKMQYRWLDCG